jgi:hypothetical protein
MHTASGQIRQRCRSAIVVGLFAGALAASGSIARGQDADGSLADQLYQQFREYRIAITQEDSKPGRFFARSILEDTLRYVGPTSDQYDDDVVELIRSTVFFGFRILAVIEYSAYVDPETSADVLRIVCGCSDSRTPVHAIEISYRREADGIRRIELITFDTSAATSTGESIVERFPVPQLD